MQPSRFLKKSKPRKTLFFDVSKFIWNFETQKFSIFDVLIFDIAMDFFQGGNFILALNVKNVALHPPIKM